MTQEPHIPPMPEGFTDQAAWDAIHWQSGWQKVNQERILAALRARADVTAKLLRDAGLRVHS